MSDELFEVAFSGKISVGSDLDEVKVNVGKLFNVDDAKLAQMFSGKRIVIKRNLDKARAAKFVNAFNRTGAECEVKSMSGEVIASPAPAPVSAPVKNAAAPSPAKKATAPAATLQVKFTSTQNSEVAPPPQVDPLGISGDQIEELSATVAPVGSAMQDEIKEVPEPHIDLSGIDVAPVGSTIGTAKKEPDPPPPNTNGMAISE